MLGSCAFGSGHDVATCEPEAGQSAAATSFPVSGPDWLCIAVRDIETSHAFTHELRAVLQR